MNAFRVSGFGFTLKAFRVYMIDKNLRYTRIPTAPTTFFQGSINLHHTELPRPKKKAGLLSKGSGR